MIGKAILTHLIKLLSLYLHYTKANTIMRYLIAPLLITLSLLLCAPIANASHFLGGEITWECLKSGTNAGKFVFTMKLYRECASGSAGLPTTTQTLKVWNHPTLNGITCNYVGKTDVSPSCYDSNLEYYCVMPKPGSYTGGAVEQGVYQSAPIVISGIPPTQGWIYSWSYCCRAGNVVNINSPISKGYTLRAIMYSYNGQNTNPCYDSSPQFVEAPLTIGCAGTSFTYVHVASDESTDQLRYEWAPAFNSDTGSWPPPYIPYAVGYDYKHPLPDSSENVVNTGGQVDSITGQISISSVTIGTHATVVKVSSYKCGVLVSEVFRDVPFVLGNCPQLPTQPNPSATTINQPPNIFIRDTVTKDTLSYNNGYMDTVVIAGDSILYEFNAEDVQWNTITKPQILIINTYSDQYGYQLVQDTGCGIAPCAFYRNNTLSGAFGVRKLLKWKTGCQHVRKNCLGEMIPYSFVFKAKDDWCPIPSETWFHLNVTVLDSNGIADAPFLKCVSVDQKGNVHLKWDPLKGSYPSFRKYYIMASSTPAAGYAIIDSTSNINDSTYIYSSPASLPLYFKIGVVYNGKCVSGISSTSNIRGTVQPIVTKNGSKLYSSVSGGIQWYLNGVAVGGATADSLQPTSSGYYFFVQTDSLGCPDTSNTIPFWVTDVPSLANMELKVAPNPFNQTTTVSLDANEPDLELHVYDVVGRELYYEYLGNRKQTTLQAKEIGKGVRLLRVNIRGQADSGKVVRMVVY